MPKVFTVVCPVCKVPMLTSTAAKSLVDGQGFVKCKNKECREWFTYMTVTTPKGSVTGHSYDHLNKDHGIDEARKIVEFLVKSGVRVPRPVKTTIDKGRKLAKKRGKSKKKGKSPKGKSKSLRSVEPTGNMPPAPDRAWICMNCGFDVPQGSVCCWSCGQIYGRPPAGLPKWWPREEADGSADGAPLFKTIKYNAGQM